MNVPGARAHVNEDQANLRIEVRLHFPDRKTRPAQGAQVTGDGAFGSILTETGEQRMRILLLGSSKNLLRAIGTHVTALGLCGLFNVVAPSRAFADIITFTVSGDFSSVDGAGGVAAFDAGSTVTIDTTTGLATGADLSLALTGGSYNGDTVTFGVVPDVINTTTEYRWSVGTTGGCPDVVFGCALDLQDTNGAGFEGFAGGAMTSGYFYTTNHFVISAVPNIVNQINLTPVATPEPSSTAMVTCLVGIMGAAVLRQRRRTLRPSL